MFFSEIFLLRYKYFDMNRISCFLVIVALFVLIGCTSQTKEGQQSDVTQTYYYEGSLVDSEGHAERICLDLMIFGDTIAIGSYNYESAPSCSYKINGSIDEDMNIELGEFREDSVLYVWQGEFHNKDKKIEGKRTELATKKQWTFEASPVLGKSYWDFINQRAQYKEYNDINTALKHKHDVLSLNLENQGLSELPDELVELDRIESINLLGNYFESFPKVLSRMKSLKEISLSSNNLSYVGPEIGELANLRILYINFNEIDSLPREIGKLKNLQYLEMGCNPINTLPEEIKNLTQLQELHIDNSESSSERFSEAQKKHIQELLPNCKIYFDMNKDCYNNKSYSK